MLDETKCSVRVGGTDISCTFSSHTAWVSCVAWSPHHTHHFVSGSYDQFVKLWDTRWCVLHPAVLKCQFIHLCAARWFLFCSSILEQRAVLIAYRVHIQGGPKKWGHRLMTIVLSNLNRFTQIFVHFLRLLAVHWRGAQSAWDINVSQGSVATYARYGGIFNMHLTANLPRYLPVKKFCESVKIWQKYGHESVARLFCNNRINNGLLNM